jgi:hypothetical protein
VVRFSGLFDHRVGLFRGLGGVAAWRADGRFPLPCSPASSLLGRLPLCCSAVLVVVRPVARPPAMAGGLPVRLLPALVRSPVSSF